MIRVRTPLSADDCTALSIGDRVLISGTIYGARDAAHKRLVDALEAGATLPFELKGQLVYYVGPCPAPPGRAIGSAGPTTSGRMDAYTPALLDAGLKGMLGKGTRRQSVVEAIVRNKCVYFATSGGAGALLASRIVAAEVIGYPELGPEALYKLEVEDFPAIVAIDSQGRDIYRTGVAQYRTI